MKKITIITGKIGSRKTQIAIEKTIECMKQNKTVVHLTFEDRKENIQKWFVAKYVNKYPEELTKEDFETTDFLSFQGGIDAGADFVMVSHLSVPNITGDNTPSSLSDKMITDILRGELGFNGIVITDAMDMKAVTDYYTSDEAAVKALQAGADMILMPEDFEAAYQGVLDAVNNGTLSEERINESLQRIYRVKYSDKVED